MAIIAVPTKICITILIHIPIIVDCCNASLKFPPFKNGVIKYSTSILYLFLVNFFFLILFQIVANCNIAIKNIFYFSLAFYLYLYFESYVFFFFLIFNDLNYYYYYYYLNSSLFYVII